MIYGENAIIKETDNHGHFDWTGRCPHCGHIELSWTRNSWISSNARASGGTKRCSKCHQTYQVKFHNM